MLRTTLVALASLLALPIAGSAATIRVISLPVKDLVYDQARQRIYASVPSSGGARANTVTLIDPSTGALGPSVFVGSEPGKLAMSDDGQYLYVGLDGAGARRAGVAGDDLHAGDQGPEGHRLVAVDDPLGHGVTSFDRSHADGPARDLPSIP